MTKKTKVAKPPEQTKPRCTRGNAGAYKPCECSRCKPQVKNTLCFNCGYGSSRVERKIKWKKVDALYPIVFWQPEGEEFERLHISEGFQGDYSVCIKFPSLKEAKRIAELIYSITQKK